MSKKHITGYIVAGLFTIVEIVIIGLGYALWHWPPSILIPALGIFTFFGVMIIVNLFSQSDDLRKGEIRNAIAASLLVVYFFFISVTLFAPASPLERFAGKAPETAIVPTKTPNPAATPAPSESQGASGIATSEEQGATSTTSVNDILKGLLDDFTKLIMVVVGFYFGGRSAEEIAKTVTSGGSGQNTTAPPQDPNANPTGNQPAKDLQKPKK